MEFTAELWEHHGQGAWVFLTVPAEASEEVRLLAGEPRGFGSVRVEVAIGATTWRTSVFPDSARGCYVLPVKAAVRRAEQAEVGDEVAVRLHVVESD
jgi:hypothetical protein